MVSLASQFWFLRTASAASTLITVCITHKSLYLYTTSVILQLYVSDKINSLSAFRSDMVKKKKVTDNDAL